LLRRGLHGSEPGGCCATTLNLFRKPGLAAGFFVVPRAAPADWANWRPRLSSLILGKLWLAFLPAVCAWLTACSCFHSGSRPLSVGHTPGLTTPSAGSDGDVNLTVLTYNVWGLPSWMNHQPKARYAMIAGTLERLHPDLVLLQEVWTRSAAAVAPAHGGWLVAQAPSANFFARNGLMVLSRLPISGGEFHPLRKAAFPDSMVRKGALKVTVQAPGGQCLDIWNVHLQSDAPQVRLRQIEQLAGWVREAEDGQAADLVGGDFNSTPDSPEFKLLSRELGQTAQEIAHLPFLPTYDGLSPDPKRAQTIDYLFIRPRRPIDKLQAAPAITFTNANPRERFSDHFALEVALRFQSQSLLASSYLTNGVGRQPVAYSPPAATPRGY